MTPRVTITKPRRCGAAMGYALHAVVVTVRGASPEQITAADDLAASFAGTQRDPLQPGRYRVRQAPPPDGQPWRMAGDADLDHVAAKADGLADALRHALNVSTTLKDTDR
jgi:hypothetical protein